MNKLYKFVSGRGRVELSESEMKELASDTHVPLEEPQNLSELSQKVERILKILESLKLISSISKTWDGDDVNGNS